MKRKRGLLRFWHKIMILLVISFLCLTIALGFAVWHSLQESGREMGQKGRAILSDQTEAFIEKLVRGQAATLDVQFRQAMAAAGYGAIFITEQLGHHRLTEIELDNLLPFLYNRVSHCAGVYFVSSSGELHQYPEPAQAEKSARSIHFHSDILRDIENLPPDSDIIWSRIHRNPLSPIYDQVIDAAAPVKMGDNFIGYVGVSLSLTRLIAQFNQHQPIRGSYSFLMDTRRQLIAGPPHAKIDLSPTPSFEPRELLDLSSVDDPDLDRVLQGMVLGESAIREAVVKGEPKYFAYHPLNAIPWRIGLVIPVKMATASAIQLVEVLENGARQTLIRMFYWCVGFLAATLIAGILLARQITAPVEELSSTTERIAAGDFSARAHVRSRDEMADLADAFNAMAQRLQIMIADLNRINEELNGKNRALKESESRYRSLSENSPDIIFTLDGDHSVCYINPAFEKILGHPRRRALGKDFAELLKPEDRLRSRALFERVFQKGEILRDAEISLIHKDGSIRLFTLSAAAEADANGTTAGLVGICKDVTDTRRLEKQLQQALKMKAVGVLAGGMAHDFNNLLAGILGNISLMLLDTSETDPYHRRLKNIEDFVQSGSSLTRQLLGFARGGKYEVKPADMNELVKKSAEMFGRTRKEITIHKHFEENLKYADVDAGQMEQVLLNLFLNAWQAMPGGGEMTIETRNVILPPEYVTAYGVEPGAYVKISVSDTGIGMDRETQQRIFEPFFTTKEMSRGTGLGLASVYGIIKNHEGIINVYSEKGKGSIFNLYLPVSSRKPEEKPRDAPAMEPGTGTLLLVDDEEMILEVGRQMLVKLGYEVLTARGGKEALQLFRNHQEKIDLVILDMIMPDMGGEAAFEALKVVDPKVRVLLSSGYSINGQAAKIMEKGCSGFIQKPFTMNQLSGKLKEVMNRARKKDATKS